MFIVFEGGEGSGKTTQAKMFYDWLIKKGYYALLTKEPGGDDRVCAKIREILLDPNHKGQFSFRAELLLFEADRAQHVERIIMPALQEGEIVVCDRYEGATYAYQCVARRVCEQSVFEFVNHYAARDFKPDFSFWLDIDPKIGLARNIANQKRDRFEMEDLSFHERVRAGYGQYFQNLLPSNKWRKIDATPSIEEIQRQILEVAQEFLPHHS